MHAVVVDRLEEYLAGVLAPAALRDIEAHLKTCEMCREEVAGMRHVSELFATLKLDAPAPSAPVPINSTSHPRSAKMRELCSSGG